jgi:hypothetical protein
MQPERPVDLVDHSTLHIADLGQPTTPPTTQPVDPPAAPEGQPAEELPIMVFAGALPAGDGNYLVQLRIVHGVTGYILELPPDRAERFGGHVQRLAAEAAAMARRANLGLILPGANGQLPGVPGQAGQ